MSITLHTAKAEKTKPENIHQGHRERLRRQYLQYGLESLSEINALELLLFYAIPRQDTNPIAHRLLRAFGSLDGVLSASVEDLMQVGKLTENAATLLTLIPDMARRQQICRAKMNTILSSTEACGNFLLPLFLGANEEMLYVLSLDAKCKLLDYTKLFTGSINSVNLSIRKVVQYALRTQATSVVLAHNHPSGVALPSQEDIATTMKVKNMLEPLDILLADHIVVADNDYVSMLDSNMLR